MEQIRDKIDAIDKKLIAILAKRMGFVVDLGKIKKQKDLPIRDKKREAEMLANIEKTAKKHGLNPLFIKKLYNEILKESRKNQINA